MKPDFCLLHLHSASEQAFSGLPCSQGRLKYIFIGRNKDFHFTSLLSDNSSRAEIISGIMSRWQAIDKRLTGQTYFILGFSSWEKNCNSLPSFPLLSPSRHVRIQNTAKHCKSLLCRIVMQEHIHSHQERSLRFPKHLLHMSFRHTHTHSSALISATHNIRLPSAYR